MREYSYNLAIVFRDTAARFPDNAALRMIDGTIMSYAALDRLSNQVAAYLKSQGVGQGLVVAIFNSKTPAAYACMLACLKLGAIYTNLDPGSPAERLKKMLDICTPHLIWANGASAARASSEGWSQVPVVNYDDPQFYQDLQKIDASYPPGYLKISGANAAYLMFTSGSTGFPKGAVMTHANLLNFIRWSKETFALTPEDRLTNLNPMHFDNSVFDFYSALMTGASMIPVPEDMLKNPRLLLDALNPLGCTVWFSVPSLIVYMLKMRALKSTDLPALKRMSFGGEGFPKTQLRALHELLGHRVTLVNVYGPTECTCICSSYIVRKEDLVPDDLLPLGPVAPNFTQLILDENKKPVADGEIGELYLGGPNVGHGYYRNFEKTSEVFIQNPLHQAYREIFYKTGDMVRFDPSADILHFCGRRDNQVKRMGYRIELEEVEFAIGALPDVVENAVVFINRGQDVGRIVAYVSSRNKDEFALIANLRRQLPSYMIPDKVVFQDTLPKNTSGKIDRRAIKELEEKS